MEPVLYHSPIDPISRLIRCVLAEKQCAFSLREEKPWEGREQFMKMNPAGQVPVLVDQTGEVVACGWMIALYIEEKMPTPPLMGDNIHTRTEVYRLIEWFQMKFHAEVYDGLVGEKILTRLMRLGQPQASRIRQAREALNDHLDYMDYLMERRKWLAGNEMTLADLMAAVYLSTVDYLGDIQWEEHPVTKEWYTRLKCRPSFRPLLMDRITGLRPASVYGDLDF